MTDMDWECSECSYSNNELLEYCELCDYPRVIEEDKISDKDSLEDVSQPSDFSQSTSYWKCKLCEYKFNMFDDRKCLMCDVINEALPPTYLLLRRQLHNDWNRGSSIVEVYKHNIVVYRNCVDADCQQLLYNDYTSKLKMISNGLGFKGIDMKQPGPKLYVSYQWPDGQEDKSGQEEPECLQLATNLHTSLVAELHDDIVDINHKQSDTGLHIPDSFEAHSLYALHYAAGEGIYFHLDFAGLDWVFIVSLGCDTHYQVYGKDETADQLIDIVLKSGDAIFFNGCNVYHAVKDVIKNTEPYWWTEKSFHRVGLQMRGYLGNTITNRKVPKPKRRR